MTVQEHFSKLSGKFREWRARKRVEKDQRNAAEAREILTAFSVAYDKLFTIKGTTQVQYQLEYLAKLLSRARKRDPSATCKLFVDGKPTQFNQDELAVHLLYLEATHFLDMNHQTRYALAGWYDNRSSDFDANTKTYNQVNINFRHSNKTDLPQAQKAIEKALKYQPNSFELKKKLAEILHYQKPRKARKLIDELLKTAPDDRELLALKHRA